MNPGRLCIAAMLGLTAVALGAFGTHGLRSVVGPDLLAVWRTAVDYQMFHALAVLALAVAPASSHSGHARFACWCFGVGVMVFSGSLYLLVLGGIGWLGAITPLGGLCLIAGWGALGIHGWRAWRDPRR